MVPGIKVKSTSDDVSLFDGSELVPLINVRVDSDPGACDEIDGGHVDEEKRHGVENEVHSFEQNAESAGHEPQEGQSEPVELEKLVVLVQSGQLVDVLHWLKI